MISNNKSIKVGANIKVNEACANVDYKYGLWNSKEEAFEALGENGDDVLAVGLTIGVLEEDGVHEYWFQKACNSVDDLVPKGVNPNLFERIKTLEEENTKLKQMLSVEDEDGNGIPDGEDRLSRIEEQIGEDMTEDDIVEAWNKVFGNENTNTDNNPSSADE